VTLTLLNHETFADVGPGDDCQATIDGVASINYVGPSRTIVTFHCTDTWGKAHVEPINIEFSPMEPDDKPFTIFISIPKQIPCTMVGMVEVYGTFDTYQGNELGYSNTVTGTIKVNQYHCFTTLVMNDKYKRTSPGEAVEFDLKVQNTGNGMDTYSIQVLNEDELESEDYVVTMSQRSFDISKFSEEVIKITVTPPKGLDTGGKQDIKLAVTCEGNNGNGTLTEFETLTVNVEFERWVFVSVYVIAPIILLVAIIVIFVFWRRKKMRRKKALMNEEIN
jgi:hypothetical protein